ETKAKISQLEASQKAWRRLDAIPEPADATVPAAWRCSPSLARPHNLIIGVGECGRWFHIRPIYLGVIFFLSLLNHLLFPLLNQLLSLFRFLPLPGHRILPCCPGKRFSFQHYKTKTWR